MPECQKEDFDAVSHTYRKNGAVVPSVTQVIAGAGLCDFSFVEEDIRVHSMKRGESVHWMLQLEDEGALNYRKVPAGLRGYRKAYRTWKCQSGFNVLWIEKQFISELGFAGTIDRAGSFPATAMYLTGTSAVLDFKTGEIADWTRYQLCAYSLAVDPRPAIARTIRRIALSLRADGTYKIKEFPLCTWDSDYSRFMRALEEMRCQKS